jgi:hypothetical protein
VSGPMPRPFQIEAYFDPDVENSSSTFSRPFYARAVREVLAHRIIEVAQGGEKDVRRLSDDAVRFLAENYIQ